MKKIIIFIVLLVFPVAVFAASNPKVLTLDAKSIDSKIEYEGTMEEGSHAVMCKLYDSNSNEIDKLSSAVDNGKFSGTFTVKDKGNYKVTCANYEGGDIKSVDVDITKVTDENPETSDSISKFLIIFISSILLLPCVLITRKKLSK